ncbi:hypothetical protein [Sphingobacterium paludis]|uniref:Uncharacterized protein n=1 Tax=Sphingobacterium paludis TaxID=1476465 RepID=A0A4R7D2B5_9SPHI|nr:hypothetical protein [Sphingobacterium paludis]TDS13714.1 hypothetical protein B0I21_10440 [Sphingobacterium paludis]
MVKFSSSSFFNITFTDTPDVNCNLIQMASNKLRSKNPTIGAESRIKRPTLDEQLS